MKNELRQSQKGFTLFEVLVVLAVVGLMTASLSGMMTPVLNWYGKRETDKRLYDHKAAFNAAILADPTTFANRADASFATGLGLISASLPNANGQCVGSSATFQPVSRYLSGSATDAWHDGFGRAFCVYVSPRLTASFNSVTYYYHSIAVVSPGVDGAISASTAMAADGTMTWGDDDVGVFIDGKTLIGNLMQGTWTVLNQYASILSAYYQSRFLSNAGRDSQIDYFANSSGTGGSNASWDSQAPNQGLLPPTVPCNTSGVSVSNDYLLGASVSDMTTPFGGGLLLDTCSAATRNPDNPTAAMAAPPYTAIISTAIPGPTPILAKTVFGLTN